MTRQTYILAHPTARNRAMHAVEDLEADQKPRKHSIEDLIEIRNLYRAKAKEIE